MSIRRVHCGFVPRNSVSKISYSQTDQPAHTCEKCASNLLDHLEQRSQRRSGGVRLPLRTPVVSLQREVLFVTGLEQRPDLPQVVELPLPHRAPLYLTVRPRRVIAQRDMADP